MNRFSYVVVNRALIHQSVTGTLYSFCYNKGLNVTQQKCPILWETVNTCVRAVGMFVAGMSIYASEQARLNQDLQHEW